ncbi:genomic island protein [Solimonas marina]|uniref:Genomic island protein n=1 Tax=Solimonas marina TaxID=2714601 RepID=A0A969W7Z9_9GAMM|nr:genomic island protein [Solimonas marina]NKF21584.1 genomic island protein [Solimonas marina]
MADGSDTTLAPSDVIAEKLIADENWQRYEYLRGRGHDDYCREVRRLEEYVLGGGKQWTEADKEVLREQGRLPLEFNEIMPAIKAAAGYQIANRMDISFQPRGGMATQELATVLSKVAMQVADNNEYHWIESDVFLDGMIQRRGFFEIRIDFDDSMRGEVRIDNLDPMDVMPDPDAKSYSPDKWADVTVSRWLTLDEIEQRYGAEARAKAESGSNAPSNSAAGEADFGDDESSSESRNKFGDKNSGNYGVYDALSRDRNMMRVRIIDRQKFVYQLAQVIVSPDTGDVRVVEGLDPEQIQQYTANGGILTKRMARRVKWTVTTYDAVLFDDWSPYPWFTIVPYFPFFRRGQSRGMVDNATGPQDALNKLGSQFIHTVNSTANSGWMVEENSLTNMTTEELAESGGKTGVVIEHKRNQKPEKIQPNQIPNGIDRMIDRLMSLLKENTVPDAARGLEGQEKSGIAIQSRQHAAQQQLSVELDNLARTRKLLAARLLWLVQTYYDDERLFIISKQDPETGEPDDETLAVNTPDPATGEIMNDLTIGEYKVVISEVPMQVTFENGQFEQAMRMKEEGVPIPDDVIIRASTLADKAEILRRMAASAGKADPMTKAKTDLTNAQARKTDADATASAVEAQFSAIQTAQVIAQTPATAPLADQILGSAGFVDRDAPPIIPNAPAGIEHVAMPQNTHPLFPAHPEHAAVGADAGIEGGQP